MPMFSVPTLIFPVLFFAMFGMPYVKDQLAGINAGQYMMSSFGTYAVMSVAMSSFSASVASERGTGWARLLRTTPIDSTTYFIGKFTMAVLFELVTLTALFTFGAYVAGIQMPLGKWLELLFVLFCGTFPFIMLGFVLGLVTGPNSATIVANLIFFPMSFASGLFMPLNMLPKFIQKAAPYLPSYNVAEWGWTTLGASGGPSIWINIVWIVGYTLGFLVLAMVVYRRDQRIAST
jgi:ABC-2 type transport system permease protein